MAILREVYNRISGATRVIFGSAAAVGLFDILKGVAKEKGTEASLNFIKVLATGKGLNNEAVYGYILGRCNLKNEERELLIRAIEELRTGSEKEKAMADNFVILVALGNPDPKNGKLPGEKIIHGFIHRIDAYPTRAKKIRMIKDNIIHIGTDAHVKTKVTVAQKWAKETWEEIISQEAWKEIIPFIDSKIEKVGDGVSLVTKKINNQYDEPIARSFERTRRRKENPLNWINPRLWLEWFIDLG